MTELPAFPDVKPALARLAADGLRLVALTNGTRKSARRQVKFAGLADALGEVYSVEAVKRYKPAPAGTIEAAPSCNVPRGTLPFGAGGGLPDSATRRRVRLGVGSTMGAESAPYTTCPRRRAHLASAVMPFQSSVRNGTAGRPAW